MASRSIESSQTDVHQNLQKRVEKHLATTFRKPIADHTLEAFSKLIASIDSSQSIILDSGCGTAMSTRLLSLAYPDSWVIGVDRSLKRLSKNASKHSGEVMPENVRLVQADLIDFWRLALEAGWKLKRHTLLYPNPYPKSVHLKRRFHASPVFPVLLALGGVIELRTNWKVYAEEFCRAAGYAGETCEGVEMINPETPLTLFEKKYQEDGQALYRVIVE